MEGSSTDGTNEKKRRFKQWTNLDRPMGRSSNLYILGNFNFSFIIKKNE